MLLILTSFPLFILSLPVKVVRKFELNASQVSSYFYLTWSATIDRTWRTDMLSRLLPYLVFFHVLSMLVSATVRLVRNT